MTISPNVKVTRLKYLSISFLAAFPNILIIPVNIKKRVPLEVKDAKIKVIRSKCIPPEDMVINL
jgi:hypothetical protein